MLARVFVSHASEDHDVAVELRQRLVEAGHEVFLDVDRRAGLQAGEDWEQRLYTELRAAGVVVCVVSSSYLASRWCAIEIAVAKSLGTRLIPILIEPSLRHPLLVDLQHIDYAADLAGMLATLDEVLRGVATDGGWPDGRSPFPGLRPFEPDWQRVFYGRERDVTALVALLRSPAEQTSGEVLTVVGPSGCGKSSLVRAGLLPAMAREPGWWVLAPVLPGEDPIAALVRELAIEAMRLGKAYSAEDIRTRLADATGLTCLADELLIAASSQQRRRRLLLVIDQFEETLTRASPERRRQFARLLAHAATGAVAVVITLRPEFLDSLLSDPDLADLKVGRPVMLRPLDADALATVIKGPAQVAGIGVDDVLVGRMVADTGAGDALPLLAFTLERLAADVRRGGRLSSEHYASLGGVTGTLAKQAYKALASARESTGRSDGEVINGLLRLVTVDEAGRPTRRRVAYNELPDSVRNELNSFVNHRLLTTDEADGVASVGVAHEAFLTAWPPLAEAVAKSGLALRSRREVEHAAVDWAVTGRPRRRLWGGGQLAAALENLDAKLRRVSRAGLRWYGRQELTTGRIDINETGRQFLHASISRDRWLRRRLITTLSGLLAVAVAAAGIAMVNQRIAKDQQHLAQEQQRIATTRQLIAQAQTMVDHDPQTALRLSLAAHRINNASAETLANTFDMLTATQYAGTFQGHSRWVETIAFMPDSRNLVSASIDGTAILWDLSDPIHPRRHSEPFSVHTGVVSSAAVTRDGRTLAIGTSDGTVILWDLSDRAVPKRLGRPFTAHDDDVTSVAFTRDGRTLASGGNDGMTILWDLSDRAVPKRLGKPFTARTGRIHTLAFAPDGVLATGSSDGAVVLWDVSDSTRLRRLGVPLTSHTGAVSSLAFAPNGRTLVSGGSMFDTTVVFWDLSNRARPRRLGPLITSHTDMVSSAAFTPDGRIAATASRDGSVILWDLSDRAHPERIGKPLGHPDSVSSVAFSPDGHMLASGSLGGTVTLWELTSRTDLRLLGPPLTHTDWVTSVAFAPDGRTMASAGLDTVVILWDLSDRSHPQGLGQPLGHSSFVHSVAFSPDGRTLAAGCRDGTVILWDLSDRARPQQIGQPLKGHSNLVDWVAFSPDGRTLASIDGQVTILWDLSNRAQPRPLDSSIYGGRAVAFAPDGRVLATGGSDGTTLWDFSDHARSRRLGEPFGGAAGASSVAFTSDGLTLASGSGDGTVTLWDMSDGNKPERLGQPLRHTSWISSIAFTPDGLTLASGSGDGTVTLWDLTDRSRPRQLDKLRSQFLVESVAFTPDGRTLASGSADGRLTLWSTGTLLDLRARAIELACAYGRGGLDRDEWARYIPGLPYQDSCPDT